MAKEIKTMYANTCNAWCEHNYKDSFNLLILPWHTIQAKRTSSVAAMIHDLQKNKKAEAVVNKMKGEAVGTSIILVSDNLLEK
jgi:hypothetical protein